MLPLFNESAYSALLLKVGCALPAPAVRARLWAHYSGFPELDFHAAIPELKPLRFASREDAREFNAMTEALAETLRQAVQARQRYLFSPRSFSRDLDSLRRQAWERRQELSLFESLRESPVGTLAAFHEELEDHFRTFDDLLWRWDKFQRSILPRRNRPALEAGLRELIDLEQQSEEEIAHITGLHQERCLGPAPEATSSCHWDFRKRGEGMELALAEEDMLWLHARVAPQWSREGGGEGFPQLTLERDRNWLRLSGDEIDLLARAASLAADQAESDDESAQADRFQARVEEVYEAWSLGQDAQGAEKDEGGSN